LQWNFWRLPEVNPFITILLLLQLVHISFFAINQENMLENKNFSISQILTLPFTEITTAGRNLEEV
jgi:hypothetical protein